MSDNKDMKGTATIAENAVLANDKRGFPFKKVFFVLLILLVIVSVCLLVLNAVIDSYFSKVTVFDGEWKVDTEKMNSMPMYQDNEAYFNRTPELHAAYDAALLNYAQASADMKFDENVYNYAVYGTDQFGESDKASADIIMLVSINKNTDRVTFASFETRILTYIPAVGVGPMSDAYYLGGPQLLANTIELNYGIQLDGFVELDMSAFVDLIDNFDNVVFKADAALVETINGNIAQFNADKGLTGDKAAKNVTLKDGKVTLDGLQALAYMRHAGANKANISNEILSQISKKISEQGLGALKDTLDISLEKTTISLLREDVGALIMVGTAVLGAPDQMPVGNMEGREKVGNTSTYTCDYQAERAALIKELY